tara:strand:- start:552 stop:836 length:285 start_codon:yes stop_codon:yes gene_type:complete
MLILSDSTEKTTVILPLVSEYTAAPDCTSPEWKYKLHSKLGFIGFQTSPLKNRKLLFGKVERLEVREMSPCYSIAEFEPLGSENFESGLKQLEV